LREIIGPDEAESAGRGGTTGKDDNEVWIDFRRNPEGQGRFSRFRCPSSLEDVEYSSLLVPRTREDWLLSLSS